VGSDSSIGINTVLPHNVSEGAMMSDSYIVWFWSIKVAEAILLGLALVL